MCNLTRLGKGRASTEQGGFGCVTQGRSFPTLDDGLQ